MAVKASHTPRGDYERGTKLAANPYGDPLPLDFAIISDVGLDLVTEENEIITYESEAEEAANNAAADGPSA